MKNRLLYRWGIYLVGLVFLALGIMLNTKTGMGVSAVVAAPYSIAALFGLNFANSAMVFYLCMVLGQFLLKRKSFRIYDLLQVPFSILFSRLLNVLEVYLPTPATLPMQLVFLALAVVCTGVGAAMSLNMRLVPNPADGMVQALSDVTGKEMGFCKNLFDFCCLVFALAAGLLIGHRVTGIGIGLGTLASMLFIGRVIAIFNKCFKAVLLERSGVPA